MTASGLSTVDHEPNPTSVTQNVGEEADVDTISLGLRSASIIHASNSSGRSTTTTAPGELHDLVNEALLAYRERVNSVLATTPSVILA